MVLSLLVSPPKDPIHPPILTYLLTPWCRVLLQKLTGLQLVKKFPTFHGTLRFITALPSVRHLSLSWASPIQSIYPHLASWGSILILSTHLRLGLPSGSFPVGFSPSRPYTPPYPHPYAPHAQPISIDIYKNSNFITTYYRNRSVSMVRQEKITTVKCEVIEVIASHSLNVCVSFSYLPSYWKEKGCRWTLPKKLNRTERRTERCDEGTVPSQHRK